MTLKKYIDILKFYVELQVCFSVHLTVTLLGTHLVDSYLLMLFVLLPPSFPSECSIFTFLYFRVSLQLFHFVSCDEFFVLFPSLGVSYSVFIWEALCVFPFPLTYTLLFLIAQPLSSCKRQYIQYPDLRRGSAVV